MSIKKVRFEIDARHDSGVPVEYSILRIQEWYASTSDDRPNIVIRSQHLLRRNNGDWVLDANRHVSGLDEAIRLLSQ